MDLRNLRLGFRDDAQRSRAQRVIHDRFADDRFQDECRYLMKFWWQLSMSYQEVTIGELREHLGADKLRAVEALIKAIGQSPEDIDEWITWAMDAFPVIHEPGQSGELRRHTISLEGAWRRTEATAWRPGEQP